MVWLKKHAFVLGMLLVGGVSQAIASSIEQ